MNRPCPDRQDRLADYLLGALAAGAAKAVQEHLDRCANCRQYLQNLQRQSETLVRLGREIGADMEVRQAKVIEALEDVAPAEAGMSRVFPFIGGYLRTAVAAVLVLGAGITIGRWTGPHPVDVGQLRAELQASVTASLQPVVGESVLAELDQRLQTGLSASDERLRAELGEQVRRDLRVLAAQFAANSERLVDERFADIVQLIEAGRRTDRERVAKALEQITTRTGLGFQTLAARAQEPSAPIQN